MGAGIHSLWTRGSLQRGYRFGNRPVEMAAPLGDVTKKITALCARRRCIFWTVKPASIKLLKKRKSTKGRNSKREKKWTEWGGAWSTVKWLSSLLEEEMVSSPHSRSFLGQLWEGWAARGGGTSLRGFGGEAHVAEDQSRWTITPWRAGLAG